MREVETAQAWYQARSVFAASAFLREFSIAVQHVREAPNRFALAEGGTRRILLNRFPFAIYDRVGTEGVVVVALAHHKRRPSYWSSR